jgi:hypothetical protein
VDRIRRCEVWAHRVGARARAHVQTNFTGQLRSSPTREPAAPSETREGLERSAPPWRGHLSDLACSPGLPPIRFIMLSHTEFRGAAIRRLDARPLLQSSLTRHGPQGRPAAKPGVATNDICAINRRWDRRRFAPTGFQTQLCVIQPETPTDPWPQGPAEPFQRLSGALAGAARRTSDEAAARPGDGAAPSSPEATLRPGQGPVQKTSCFGSSISVK